MSGLKAPVGGNNSKLQESVLEDGSYGARVVRVVDWGVQPPPPNDKYGKGPVHTINVTFELPEEFMADEKGEPVEDKPRWVGRRIPLRPLSSDLAISTAWSKAIDVKGEFQGDWSQYLGLPVEVVLKNNGAYLNVDTLNPMRSTKAAKLDALKNDAFFFDLQNPNLENFNKLSTWEQSQICNNVNFKGSKLYDLLDGKAVVWEKGKKPEKQEDVPVQKEEPKKQEEEGSDVPW